VKKLGNTKHNILCLDTPPEFTLSLDPSPGFVNKT